MQNVDDQNDLDRFQSLYERHSSILHKNHYLLLLLKRHIIVLSSPHVAKMSLEELDKLQQLSEEVGDHMEFEIYSAIGTWYARCAFRVLYIHDTKPFCS